MKLIDDYFSDSSFFKPTGDGLLIIVPYTEENLKEKVIETITTCLNVINDFGTFCDNDQMINFDVPHDIGIGVSRSSACSLKSGDKILDYSGSVLNLASRLMDLARPSGIVFDSNFGVELLSPEMQERFTKDSVYLKGIAESEPIDVFFTKEYTRISPQNKRPIKEINWKTTKEIKTLKTIIEIGENYWIYLPLTPIDSKKISVKISHEPALKGRKQKGFHKFIHFPFKYFFETGQPSVVIDFVKLAEKLKERGVGNNWEINIEVTYPT